MKIEYLGHACFRINDELVIDPYKDGSVPGLEPLRIDAAKVICTHEHADHSGRECVKTSGAEIGCSISEVESFHDDQGGKLRGPNTIFVIETEGKKLVHLGDLGHFPNDEQLEKISAADYLMIPVGGYYTIDAAMAAKICAAAKPKKIIPMHYRGDGFGYPELATVDEFLSEIAKVGLADQVTLLQKSDQLTD